MRVYVILDRLYDVLIDDKIKSELEPIVPAAIIKPTSTSPSRQSLSGGSHINKAAVTSDHETTVNVELKRSIASNTPPVQKHSLADYSPLASSSLSSFSSYDSYCFSPPTQTSPDGRIPPIVNLTDLVGDDNDSDHNDNDYLDDVFHKEVYDNVKQKLKETLL